LFVHQVHRWEGTEVQVLQVLPVHKVLAKARALQAPSRRPYSLDFHAL